MEGRETGGTSMSMRVEAAGGTEGRGSSNQCSTNDTDRLARAARWQGVRLYHALAAVIRCVDADGGSALLLDALATARRELASFDQVAAAGDEGPAEGAQAEISRYELSRAPHSPNRPGVETRWPGRKIDGGGIPTFCLAAAVTGDTTTAGRPLHEAQPMLSFPPAPAATAVMACECCGCQATDPNFCAGCHTVLCTACWLGHSQGDCDRAAALRFRGGGRTVQPQLTAGVHHRQGVPASIDGRGDVAPSSSPTSTGAGGRPPSRPRAHRPNGFSGPHGGTGNGDRR